MSNSSDDYVSLHQHTNFSILDGCGRIPDLMRRAVEIGQPAIAITDHGTVAGLYAGWREAKKIAAEFGRPFRCLGGIEIYMIPDRLNPPPRKKRKRGSSLSAEEEEGMGDENAYESPTRNHLTLICMNQTGYDNLMQIIWKSNQSGVTGGWGRRIPLCDLALLAEHSEGIYCLSGCALGMLADFILLKDLDRARDFAVDLQRIYHDRLALEVMPSTFKRQRKVNIGVLQIANEMKLPVVATNDSHWVRQEDVATHEVLCAIQTKSRMSEPPQDQGGKRFRLSDQCYWLRTRAEMEAAFAAVHGDYISRLMARSFLDHTLQIAEQVTFTGPKFEPSMPHLDLTGQSVKEPETAREMQARYQRFLTWRETYGISLHPGVYSDEK